MGNVEPDVGRESERIDTQPIKIEAPPRKSMKEMKTRAGLILCYVVIGLIGLESLI